MYLFKDLYYFLITKIHFYTDFKLSLLVVNNSESWELPKKVLKACCDSDMDNSPKVDWSW